jgi:hypothetical protein
VKAAAANNSNASASKSQAAAKKIRTKVPVTKDQTHSSSPSSGVMDTIMEALDGASAAVSEASAANTDVWRRPRIPAQTASSSGLLIDRSAT